jgi:hypothetical protein
MPPTEINACTRNYGWMTESERLSAQLCTQVPTADELFFQAGIALVAPLMSALIIEFCFAITAMQKF